MVNPRHQTPQGQSVAKPGTLLQNILDGNLNMTHVWMCPSRWSWQQIIADLGKGLAQNRRQALPELILTQFTPGRQWAKPIFSLKTDSCHNVNFVITSVAADSYDDNSRCRQWRQSWYHDNSRFSCLLQTTLHMMTSSNGNIFRVTGPLCGKFTCHRSIPFTKASGAELWYFLWSAPE